VTALALLIALCAPEGPTARPAPSDAPAPAPAQRVAVIDRASVLALFQDPDPLAGEVWFAMPDAKMIQDEARGEKVYTVPTPGIELRGIPIGSRLYRAGLRAGDIIQRLDGTEIGRVSDLAFVGLRLRARLMMGDGWTFQIGILRRDRPLTLTYRVESRAPAGRPALSSPAAPQGG